VGRAGRAGGAGGAEAVRARFPRINKMHDLAESRQQLWLWPGPLLGCLSTRRSRIALGEIRSLQAGNEEIIELKYSTNY